MTTQSFSLVFLAGGTGSRMGKGFPKQFLELNGRPLAFYSLDVFLAMPEMQEIVIVCAPEYRSYFSAYKNIKWALPGKRRQDSVFNGLQETNPNAHCVCVHDGCRPFINDQLVRRVLKAAYENGASSAAVPVQFTVKEIDSNQFVTHTPNRDFFWEIQTPQIVQRDILQKGFEKAHQSAITVTDDTALAELIGKPVKLVEGSYTNIKITRPIDFALAKCLLDMPNE